ncbi:L-threonylcarbamoyladenylate synthase [Brevibacterium litoralis]|uniref:L-threonylcarbamoyladenylate synthase n=1 Tax=Brevibacterium litoralis TaxID=3138935 RepID=UPI0032EE6EE3
MSRTFDLGNVEVRDLVLAECERVVRDDRLIVVPTDTVYGIAADAFSQTGVQRLLAAKGRGRQFPPPVLVKGPETVPGLAEVVDDRVFTLLKRFWPGPLTVILGAQPSLDWDLGDTHGTVAVRMPDEERTLELLRLTGPLAVSSANTHGDPAATTAAEASEMLGDSVDIYLDGGPTPGSASSTIVDLTATPPRIVRSGPVSVEALREVVPELLDLGEEPPAADTDVPDGQGASAG